MIRLGVTDLDGYLYWRGREDMELDELIKRLRGTAEPTPAMLASRVFHKMLENAGPGELHTYSADGWDFEFDVDAEITLLPFNELKAEHVIETPSGQVTLVGKVDRMNGHEIRDYKLTERFDPENYLDSYQWRSYLWMFGAKRFVYDAFVADYDLSEGRKHVRIRDYQQFAVYAYPGMDKDVRREVSDLAAIITRHVPEKVVAD